MRILIPNLGSTSLKYQLLELPSEQVLARGKIERLAGLAGYREALGRILDRHLAGGIDAIGLKAVHAGLRFRGAFLVTLEVLAAMRE